MMRPALIAIAAAAMAAPAAPAVAQDGAHAGHAAHVHHAAAAPAGAGAKVMLSGAPLLDASGRRVRLASDVIAGKIAVVNFIYTNCTTVCPVTSATFELLQRRLGAALGRDVVLVSITVDPLRDTPKRLREYSSRYEAGAGWTWLTGDKRDVDQVLEGFGAYTPNFEDHPVMVLVGDAREGTWTRLFGFPGVDQIAARIDGLREARMGAHHAHHHQQASQ